MLREQHFQAGERASGTEVDFSSRVSCPLDGDIESLRGALVLLSGAEAHRPDAPGSTSLLYSMELGSTTLKLGGLPTSFPISVVVTTLFDSAHVFVASHAKASPVVCGYTTLHVSDQRSLPLGFPFRCKSLFELGHRWYPVRENFVFSVSALRALNQLPDFLDSREVAARCATREFEGVSEGFSNHYHLVNRESSLLVNGVVQGSRSGVCQ